MRIIPILALAAFIGFGTDAGAAEKPAWAYPINPSGFRPPADDGGVRRVPDSALGLTLTQVRDWFYAPDWHPSDRPAMPQSVASGRRPDVLACGFCHRTNGAGGPENANLTGLTADYIVRRMGEFRDGAHAFGANRVPTTLLLRTARNATAAEVQEAADYFASLPPVAMIDVVEADTVPAVVVMNWHLAVDPAGAAEPLGQRIVEVPADLERFTSRDGRVRFTAYVPPGSVERGRVLAATGGDGVTVACGACHGTDLKGAGVAPSIVGRSPSFVVRQLIDFRAGDRTGQHSAQMAPTVEKLSIEDMIALAAFTASLRP